MGLRKLSKVMKISDKSTRSNVTVSKLGQIRASSNMQAPSKRPKVSVVMSVFNDAKYVGRTIESVLGQTFDDFEFIIVNDGSTDRTQEILEGYARKDGRIKILVNKNNIGLAKSLNEGIMNSKGKYIARIDAADICKSDRFEKQVRFLDENETVCIVGSYHYWINETGQVFGIYWFPTSPQRIQENLFNFASIAAHPTLMFRRRFFEEIGLYSTSYPTSMEYELYVRAIANGMKIANIPEPLVYVARRSKGISVSKIKAIFVNQLKIRARYLPRLLSFRNVVFTVASLLFVLIPSVLLENLVKISIVNQRIRAILLGSKTKSCS